MESIVCILSLCFYLSLEQMQRIVADPEKNKRVLSPFLSNDNRSKEMQTKYPISEFLRSSILRSFNGQIFIRSIFITAVCMVGNVRYGNSGEYCNKCPIGFYSPSINQMNCTPCATGESTESSGSSASTDCSKLLRLCICHH